MTMRALQGWTLALLLMAAAPAGAQPAVALQFEGGRVSLSAQNVPVRMILNEWARVGGTAVVNADKVAQGPVTIEFVGVPERQALDILLRNVAGYVLGPRPSGAIGASSFDRILILPTSAAPAYVGPGTAPPAVAEPQRPVLPAFLARRPDLGVEGPRQPRPEGVPAERTGIFGPGFRDNPPVPPNVPPPTDDTPDTASAVETPTNIYVP